MAELNVIEGESLHVRITAESDTQLRTKRGDCQTDRNMDEERERERERRECVLQTAGG